jgi:hypothetical protein
MSKVGFLELLFRLYLDELEDTQVLSELCVFEGQREGSGVELGIDIKQDHSPKLHLYASGWLLRGKKLR